MVELTQRSDPDQAVNVKRHNKEAQKVEAKE